MICLNNISKRYKKYVIKNFSYTFKKGSIYGIIGKSGCGKSSLLNIIAGIDKNYKGLVTYKNKNIKKSKNYTFLNVSYVNQKNQLIDNMTALENVCLYFDLLNIKKEKYFYKIKNMFSQFNISHVLNMKVKDLSGGEKQRVAFIKALIKDSEILLLDEPTSALDEDNTNLLMVYLNKIKKDKIIIIVTHNQALSTKVDFLIDLLSHPSINNLKRIDVGFKEERIKFYNLKLLHKKVFQNSKIFNYIASGILSFGLITIGLSFSIKDFINDVISTSFSLFDNSSKATLIASNDNENIDFNKEFDNCVYYEGIESLDKQKIKESSKISHVDFNYYDISNKNFIFDNYLSKHEENMVLYVPSFANEYVSKSNFINVYCTDYEFKIKVDRVYQSSDDNFYIYCNNIAYLNNYFINYKITISKSCYLYCNNIESTHKKIVSDEKYKNYVFYKDKENNVIQIVKSSIAKLSTNKTNQYIKENEIEKYLVSDYTHTYIDYENGFYYVNTYKNEMVLSQIDESLQDNQINISSKLKKDKNIDKNVKICDKFYDINEVIPQDNYSIIYMNMKTFNSFNNLDYIYGMLLYDIDSKSLNKIDGIMCNTELFKISSMKSFSYITNFLSFFSLLIIILAFISCLVIFSITLKSKRKEILYLKSNGIYKNVCIMLLTKDNVSNIFSAVFSGLLTVFVTKVLISQINYSLNNVMLDVKISLIFLLFYIVSPFLLILPMIIVKILLTLNKKS